MIKLFCIVCDNPACCKVISNKPIIVKARKRKLHFCNDKCSEHYYINKYKDV